MKSSLISGFSRLSKNDKISLLQNSLGLPRLMETLSKYWHPEQQILFDAFSENTVSNFYLPYGIAPNLLINGDIFHVPMVTEESSVIAAVSSAAKFWADWGGFRAVVVGVVKSGHVYFNWKGSVHMLNEDRDNIFEYIRKGISGDLASMQLRGGGLVDMRFGTNLQIPGLFYLEAMFDTVDAMGANLINTVMEHIGVLLNEYWKQQDFNENPVDVVMAILSNHIPGCLVRCSVEAPIKAFDSLDKNVSGRNFAERMHLAVQIAETDLNRAVTHNKGIMNGIDAVVLATGNDFRAIEAGAHAYAACHGKYTSLSSCGLNEDKFTLSLEIPLALGSVGGLTKLHPLANCSLEILGNPSAIQLMMIVGSVGLASHFSALRALVTKGIQKGHMKMHLSNILLQLKADQKQIDNAIEWFADKEVSFKLVREFLGLSGNSKY